MTLVKTHSIDLSHLKILITGGAGFIGSHLAEYFVLNGAQKVIVLDDLSTGFESNIEHLKSHKNFTFIKGSITDLETCQKACKDISIVLHHAALGSVPRSVENPMKTNEINVGGFVNMLFAAKENEVKKFVYASSSSVYGDDETTPKIETKTGNLLSPYAVSKYTNEQYARVFSSLYNMQTIGLRYFNVFGERQNPDGPYAAVIPKFISSLLNNKQAGIHGSGTNTRDFTYVANVVKANLLCVEKENIPLQTVMNIACGGTISVNEIYRQVAMQLNKADVQAIYLPERPGEIKNSYADIALAQKTLGYQPLVTLEEGLKKTVNWFKNNKCI
jgi:UDP-N-acetylglucosamine 4-epimerase